MIYFNGGLRVESRLKKRSSETFFFHSKVNRGHTVRRTSENTKETKRKRKRGRSESIPSERDRETTMTFNSRWEWERVCVWERESNTLLFLERENCCFARVNKAYVQFCYCRGVCFDWDFLPRLSACGGLQREREGERICLREWDIYIMCFRERKRERERVFKEKEGECVWEKERECDWEREREMEAFSVRTQLLSDGELRQWQ